jgi:hypothetical protein
MNGGLKLYCFQPKGFGEYSAFVMANSEEEARECARKALHEQERAYEKYSNWDYQGEMPEYVSRTNMEGFDTDYYIVTVLDVNEVAFNANE